MTRTLGILLLLGAWFPAPLLAAPITFNLRDPYIESIDEVNSFNLTIDGLTATLQALPEIYDTNDVVLNQTSSSFGINVLNTSCGSTEESGQVDGGCTGESLQVRFSQDVLLNSLRVSSFGSADQGLSTVYGASTVPILSTGLLSLGNLYLAAGDAWSISFLTGNGFSVDSFAVSTVPESSTLLLLTAGVFGLVFSGRTVGSRRR